MVIAVEPKVCLAQVYNNWGEERMEIGVATQVATDDMDIADGGTTDKVSLEVGADNHLDTLDIDMDNQDTDMDIDRADYVCMDRAYSYITDFSSPPSRAQDGLASDCVF